MRRNTIILVFGILAFFFLATLANAQTLKSDNVFFITVLIGGSTMQSLGLYEGSIVSVTIPSTKDPKWTILCQMGGGTGFMTIVTTFPVYVLYRAKEKGSVANQIEPE